MPNVSSNSAWLDEIRIRKVVMRLYIPESAYLDELALESLAVGIYGEDELFAHAKTVADWSRRLALAMGLDLRSARATWVGGLFHDLGKTHFRDILRKPGPLNSEEWVVIKEHPRRSWELLQALGRLNVWVAANPEVQDSVLYHHERMDGGGYPDGLKGQQIPLSARIVQVADVFAALTADRVYRGAKTPSAALATMAKTASQFDPAVFAALRNMVASVGTGLVQRNQAHRAL